MSVPRTLPVIYGVRCVAPRPFPSRPRHGRVRKTRYFGFRLLSRSAKHRSGGQSRGMGGGGGRVVPVRTPLKRVKNKDRKEIKINSPSADAVIEISKTRNAGATCAQHVRCVERASKTADSVAFRTRQRRIVGPGRTLLFFFSRPMNSDEIRRSGVSNDSTRLFCGSSTSSFTAVDVN